MGHCIPPVCVHDVRYGPPSHNTVHPLVARMPEFGTMDPRHPVDGYGSGSSQYRVAPKSGFGKFVMTHVSVVESGSNPRRRYPSDRTFFRVTRGPTADPIGRADTSTSAEPASSTHDPSSATHATYLSATDGVPGDAKRSEGRRDVGDTKTRPWGSSTSTGVPCHSAADNSRVPRAPPSPTC